jgi:hypothetical protein
MNVIHSVETTLHHDATFSPGLPPLEQTWLIELPDSVSFDVFSISWDIFTEDEKDLLNLIWTGALEWSFSAIGPSYRIGHLSLYDGSFLDSIRRPSGQTDLKQIVSARGEAELLELLRHHQRGNGSLYRGLKTYKETSFILPPGSPTKLRLLWSEPLPLRAPVRLRVNLNGIYQRTFQVK